MVSGAAWAGVSGSILCMKMKLRLRDMKRLLINDVPEMSSKHPIHLEINYPINVMNRTLYVKIQGGRWFELYSL
jgi:hypothetical protein